jgi:REP-associated tyrosine transposase
MRHAGVVVYVHVTWDRLPLIADDIECEIYRAIGAKCAEMGSGVIAVGGIEDHVHLLASLPAAVTLAQLVGQAKGASSHLVTHELLHPLQFFKWQGSYGAVSVSPDHLDAISHYIANQKAHHQAQSLIPAWEPHTTSVP